jgi:hypothetical protein
METEKKLLSNPAIPQLSLKFEDVYGVYAYRCSATASFDNKDTVRFGWAVILPTQADYTVVEVYGLRIGSMRGKRKFLQSRPWRGNGSVGLHDGKLTLKYQVSGSDDRGVSTDEFVKKQPELAAIWPGTFTHIERSGNQVEGEINLIPLHQKTKLPHEFDGSPFDLFDKLTPLEKGKIATEAIKAIYNILDHTANPYVVLDLVNLSFKQASLSDIDSPSFNFGKGQRFSSPVIVPLVDQGLLKG